MRQLRRVLIWSVCAAAACADWSFIDARAMRRIKSFAQCLKWFAWCA